MFVCSALTLVAIAAAAPVEPGYSRAIVIGNNSPLPGSDPDAYRTLHYADDDALRFGRFFESIGVETTILTTFDAQTDEKAGALAARVRRPTRRALLETIGQIERELENAPANSEVFFVFSGHGSIDASGAYLHLFDEPFSRIDLFEQVLKRLRASRVHVIIDSCHSWFLVNSRGKRVAIAGDEESLDRFPWVGFMLSTSDKQEVQEWSGYQGGVFSYQVVSALRGAADVDGDGRVTYAEVHGYVLSANMGIRRADARIQPYVKRPATGPQHVVRLDRLAVERKVRLGPDFVGHFYIHDDEGRVVDAHKAAGAPLTVLLPQTAPLSLVRGDDVYQVRTSTSGFARLRHIERTTVLASKGTIADELRENLFKVPLTLDFVRGLEAAASVKVAPVYVHRAPAGVWYGDPLTVASLGAGVLSTVAGLIATGFFFDARAAANARPVDPSVDREDVQQRVLDARLAMTIGYSAGAVLLLTGVLRAFLTNDVSDLRTDIDSGEAGALFWRF